MLEILTIILFEYLDNGLLHDPSKSDFSKAVAESLKKRKTNNFSSNANDTPRKKDNKSILFPHLVYKIDFLESKIAATNFWYATNSNDFLKSIIEERELEAQNSTNGTRSKAESKIIVVLELPVEGQVSQYNIGDTDDTLEVEILKHSLMLHPKALLFFGIRAGILNEAKDGPETA